ncbi:Fe-S cluster assembly ATPase SufC [Candidatus Peregrinibacteria bacterium]|jgi:Fe-S cluster assembly ATP-binding protein|nr:Fe-S cluster assembly ATPase SufC [Candidatus Peregrinibacteria bacterium]MBT3598297.1 Fe-S cluster assembly ATPase SufC [Candidatus Peregrinibacteria bacterium]MBT4367220.1 Fe-S cluster assembly ATPase SufC [Candidatus Peregrinibacteria bacterium]MBT4586247.1 Fe-S cluster assembly ATPase SufC [Candidatus Peregrinibacteria bacterium]MBT6731030.1 Fe-S cluster assembly ATPase SufC [Candidatus Peregrinibacteria bacterium]
MSVLDINDLHISVGGKEVVHGVNLKVQKGEIHAIMGPNGSGKSSLIHALMGHPSYLVTKGSIKFNGNDLLIKKPHERAQMGIFLGFQNPREIAGVTVQRFLHAAYNACNPDKKMISPIKFHDLLINHMKELHMDPVFADRFLNVGFSGGEKKKLEILQMKVLCPLIAFLDETDSGLDVDALRVVSDGISSMKNDNFSAILVTHYARILNYIKPDIVHVMHNGSLVETGGADLANSLEKEGYARFSDS